jgi:hypothetical protein
VAQRRRRPDAQDRADDGRGKLKASHQLSAVSFQLRILVALTADS